MIGRLLVERKRPRGEAESDIVNAHVVEPGPRADDLPRPVDVCHVPARFGSRIDPGIAGFARQGLEDADRRRRQVNRAGASLPVGEMNLGRVEIDMPPAQGQDFVSSATRQHEQTDRRHRAGRYAAALAQTSSSTCPSRVNSVSVRNRARLRLGFIGMDRHGWRSSGAMPQSLARAYMCVSVLTVMLTIAGGSHRLSCNSMTCWRSTAASVLFGAENLTPESWDLKELARRSASNQRAE